MYITSVIFGLISMIILEKPTSSHGISLRLCKKKLMFSFEKKYKSIVYKPVVFVEWSSDTPPEQNGNRKKSQIPFSLSWQNHNPMVFVHNPVVFVAWSNDTPPK